MASRDKKPTAGRKLTTSASLSQADEPDASTPRPAAEDKHRKPSVRAKKAATKRTVPLKAKSKVAAPVKLGKRAAAKSTLLKNGVASVAAVVIRKRPLSLRERIVPPSRISGITEERTKPRIKREPLTTAKLTKKKKKKMKKEKDAIDEDAVLGDAPPLLTAIKTEPEEETMPVLEEAVKTPPGRRASKAKAASESEIMRKEIKKEGIDGVLEKLTDYSESNVIDSLDLNVNKLLRDNKKTAALVRRHSIEKFPITLKDVGVLDDSALVIPAKVKRPRGRPPTVAGAAKPSTRRRESESKRMLRNGKTRRLHQFPLLDGLDSEYKMRRRLASDFSGSEVSKHSGYESDSSMSSSIQENLDTNKDKDKDLLLKKEILETIENNPPETAEGKQIVEKVSAAIKRSLSMETAPTTATATTPLEDASIDTNSNLCSKSDPVTPLKEDFVADVPKLLGIMKQAFNDNGVVITEETSASGDDADKRTTRSTNKKDKSSPDVEVQAAMKETTISTLTAVSMALGPDITITAEEVQRDVQATPTSLPETTIHQIQPESPEEAELIDILNRHNAEKDKSPQSTPGTSVNGGSPANDSKTTPMADEAPEVQEEKTQILKALGLQTLQEAEEARKKQVPKAENYTGTLKTVIKLNRCPPEKKKIARNPIKMTLQKKGKTSAGKDDEDKGEEEEYKIMKESTTWKHHGSQSSDTAGAQRKSHYSNRSNLDGSSEHTSDGDTNHADEGAPGKLLVIPEKASSFSIHPGRLCKDECSYCFGKFGLFDTPCHIAQMKSVERQDKILSNEKHLTRDSCLCDACYRHVDRKTNMASCNKSKRSALVAPAPRENHCHVLGCNKIATNILKRKWLIKMRKAVCQVINIDLDNPGLHSIPACKEHYAAVEHLMVCAMCKARLARNHIYYLGAETNDIQLVLNKMGIPVKLNEKPVVCKLCRYFASLVVKSADELPKDGPKDARSFCAEYKRRLRQAHNVDESMDESDMPEPLLKPQDAKHEGGSKKRKRDRRHNDPPILEPQVDIHSLHGDEPSDTVPSSESRPDSPSDYNSVDIRNLIPNVAIECLSDVEITKKSSLSISRITKAEAQAKKRARSDIAVQRLGCNPSISIRQMFPGEEDVPLNGHIDFGNPKERTPEGWEKCTTTIQYDPDTKALWQELQKPYGNQSSFLRHLILLEKYFRNGDLVLSPRASNMSTTYAESAQNRLKAYDNISANAGPGVLPMTMLPFNNPKMSFNSSGMDTSVDKSIEKIDKTQTTILPMAMSTPIAGLVVNQAQLPKNTPLTITQHPNSVATISATTVQIPIGLKLPNTPVTVPTPIAATPALVAISNPPVTSPPPLVPSAPAKSKPPGLISLHAQKTTSEASTAGGVAVKPQSQKIKFPITKNWRPKLIPIDPAAAKQEKKPGLVQVISGGKPYHITMEDYKKMCAIKRTYDLRQKRLQETLKSNAQTNPNSLLKTSAGSKKSKSPSTSDHEENSIELKMDKPKAEKPTPATLPLSIENKMPMNLPKIPKSLTVIPQTVTINKSRSRSGSPKLGKTGKTKS